MPKRKKQSKAHGERILKLNVGGTIFSTTPTTLKNSPYFRAMFASPMTTTLDSAGRIFIDRDPTAFRAILMYLRNDLRPRQSDDYGVPFRHVAREMEYFGLSETKIGGEKKKSQKSATKNQRWYRELYAFAREMFDNDDSKGDFLGEWKVDCEDYKYDEEDEMGILAISKVSNAAQRNLVEKNLMTDLNSLSADKKLKTLDIVKKSKKLILFFEYEKPTGE